MIQQLWKGRSRTQNLTALLILGALLGLAGCIGAVTIVVAPAATVVELGESVAFSASTNNGAPVVGVTWSVSAGPGSIDASTGVYTAPSAGITDVTLVTVEATKGTATGEATVTIAPPKTAELVDSDVDAFNGAAYDVTSLKLERTAAELIVTYTLSAAITTGDIAPVGGVVQAGDFGGFLDMDTDQSFATGANSANSTYCPSTPPSAIGSDRFLSMFERNGDGNYPILDTDTLAVVDDADVSVSGDRITITIPLSAGDDAFNVNSVIGDDAEPTDCLPDEGAAVVSPEGTGLKPEIDIVGNPHMSYLSSIGIVWQTPSSSI